MRRKAKLYLSKSNAADTAFQNQFMAAIRSLDVTFNEYTGASEYRHTSMLAHDYILILPPEQNESYVGRGQYEQIKYIKEHTEIEILFVNEIYYDDDDRTYKIRVSEVKDVDIYDPKNWTDSYGIVNHNDSYIDIYNYDGILPKPKPKTYDPLTFQQIVDSSGSVKQTGIKMTSKKDSPPEKRRRRVRLSAITLFKS